MGKDPECEPGSIDAKGCNLFGKWKFRCNIYQSLNDCVP